MSSGAKVAVVVAVVVVAGMLIVGGLVAAGMAWFWVRADTRMEHVEAARMQAEIARAEAQRAVAEAVAQAPDMPPPPPPPALPPPAPGEGAVSVTATIEVAPDAAALAARRQAAIEKGVAFLVASQAKDGSWGDGNVGITALCADALVECGQTAADPAVRRAVDFMLKSRQDDGGIYGDAELKNYTTSIALSVLVKTDAKAYAEPIEKAKAYLVKTQWDEEESIDRSNPWYGGAGYGKHERPDLSNTQYFVQAMHDAGLPKDHPLWAKVVVFVSRTQDRSESNDGAFVGTDSGGMVYAPVKAGESKAGTVDLPDGRKGLKAYGSMTYAGFKSFIYADLQRDDARVQAALDWVRKHWTFEENPEMGQQGLFYYYETAAKALKAWGEDNVMDARRRTHDWRAELSEAILKRQRPDGSWTNEADRWFEGFPPVPTSYALIALAQCRAR